MGSLIEILVASELNSAAAQWRSASKSNTTGAKLGLDLYDWEPTAAEDFKKAGSALHYKVGYIYVL